MWKYGTKSPCLEDTGCLIAAKNTSSFRSKIDMSSKDVAMNISLRNVAALVQQRRPKPKAPSFKLENSLTRERMENNASHKGWI